MLVELDLLPAPLSDSLKVLLRIVLSILDRPRRHIVTNRGEIFGRGSKTVFYRSKDGCCRGTKEQLLAKMCIPSRNRAARCKLLTHPHINQVHAFLKPARLQHK